MNFSIPFSVRRINVLPISELKKLWNSLQGFYGSRWVVEYGELNGPLATVWARALGKITPEQLSAGMNACLERDSPHPPSLPEFMRLCGYSHEHQATGYHTAPSDWAKKPMYADTPAQRCARLAEKMQAEAMVELEPRLSRALPTDHRQIIASYWLSRIAAIGAVGKTIATTLQNKIERETV